ncbi:hypothetical protein M407DRAFT_18513 [Tulasnella calospora MUT 4182]|uniref:Uncharacterized protein n=1 Tax=Tulasnella calospora MUT 4182 TaxID=1051891 RepID=A0A0C3MFG3_9AGAM|nr:hypothetical protein M407DRAFT_18513 [Tulasnella calospora MUT 4182]
MADEIPTLKAQDAVELLAEWSLNITVEEINKPTTQTVQAIYDEMIWQLLHIRLDDLDGPRNIIMQDMDNSELYGEGLKLRMFFHLVRHLCTRAGVEGFSLQDVARPDGLRLRKTLSIVRNLLAFKNERADFINSTIQRMEDAKQREQELLEEEQRLREEYNAMLRKRAAEESQIPEAKQRNAQVKKLLNAQHKKFEQVKNAADAAKKEGQSLRTRWETVTAELDTTKQRNNRDRGRIVQSPDRLRRTIANLSASVEQERTATEQNQAKERDYKAKLAQLQIIEEDYRTSIDLLQSIEVEQKRLEKCEQDLNTVKTHYSNRVIEHRELTTRAEQLERQLAFAHDKLESMQRSSAEKRELSMQKIEKLKEQYAQVDEARSNMLAEHDLLRKDIETIEKEMSEYIRSNEKLLNDLMAEYWSLRQDLDNFMATLANKFGLDIDPSVLPALANMKKKKVKA